MATISRWFKTPYRISTVTVLAALWLSAVHNVAFFRAAFTVIDKTATLGWDFKLALALCLPALFSLLLSLVGFKVLFKPSLMVILVLAAVISYFSGTFGVIIDTSMIQNAFETDTKEALELVNIASVGHVLLLGVFPAWLIYRLPLQVQPFFKEVASRLLVMLIAASVLAGSIFCYYKEFSLTMRENRELRFLINPTYPVYALVKYLKQVNASQVQITPIALDAKQQPLPASKANGKPSLVVIVVGETARAENFSLNGYARDTNPELRKLDMLNFTNTYSCGTATAESVPCMFSPFGKDVYTVEKARQHENLLDVLSRAGITVLWRDNNSGCKGVCERVNTEAMERLNVPELCNSEECFDEILLHDLAAALAALHGDVVLVLHQKGSHGPAYFKRHPAAFTPFAPECVSGQVQDCPQAELLNAYDNTIRYTDAFLAKTVRFLETQAQHYNTAFWYMSDHGESLGENGIYLHGLPYFLAPDQQIHIPFMLWLSPELRSTEGIDAACLRQQQSTRFSHDYLFHSILGLLRVSTSVYKPNLDVFAACRH